MEKTSDRWTGDGKARCWLVVGVLNTDRVTSGGSKDSRLHSNASAGESISLEVDWPC